MGLRNVILSGPQSQALKVHPLCGLHAPANLGRAMGIVGGAMDVAQGEGMSTGTSRLDGECKNGAHQHPCSWRGFLQAAALLVGALRLANEFSLHMV